MSKPPLRLTPVEKIPQASPFYPRQSDPEFDAIASKVLAEPGQAFHVMALPKSKESNHYASNFRNAMRRRGVVVNTRTREGFIHVFVKAEGAK